MKIRKITSLTALLAFMVMLLTSIVLYIVPQGRVAYWADWRLWGLTKTDWGNIHIAVGFLFLVTLGLHVYYNWKPMISYLKNKVKQIKVFTPEFNLALVITVLVAVGTYFAVPPFSYILSLNGYFKDAGAEKYGEPPYGHAELSSLTTFAKKMNLDLEKSMELLEKAGYPVESSQTTLETIGRRYNITPKLVYETIKPASMEAGERGEPAAMLPESPPPGTGNLTLADFCTRFELNMKQVVRELKKQNIVASEALTLKQIAADNTTSPIDLYERIKGIVENG
jgi:hypothetical protein